MKKLENYKELIKENSSLKSNYKDKSVELEKCKDKEMKLMKIIFFLNKKKSRNISRRSFQ